MTPYTKLTAGLFLVAALALLPGCFILENTFFPVWEPNDLDPNPANLGPHDFAERIFPVEDGADGKPFGITIFEPSNTTGPLPVFIWVMGSNVQAYYHQSLHEALASWGYLVLVPDTRKLRFADLQYHNRLVKLAAQTLEIAKDGALGPKIDLDRIAVGGYSVGGPLAAFLAARKPDVDAVVHWAPAGAPFWQGLNANELFAQVAQTNLYVLGELDEDAPPEGGFPDDMQARMPGAPFEELVIEGAVHHQFQQPIGADQFSTQPTITREEQQGIAINWTRQWLDERFGLSRETGEGEGEAQE